MMNVYRRGRNPKQLVHPELCAGMELAELLSLFRHQQSGEIEPVVMTYRMADMMRGVPEGFGPENKLHFRPVRTEDVRAKAARHIGLDIDEYGDLHLQLSIEADTVLKNKVVPNIPIDRVSETPCEFTARGIDTFVLLNAKSIETERRYRSTFALSFYDQSWLPGRA